MRSSLETLATAIADVGYWRWWAESFPDVFQLEFAGVQLWSPAPADGRPPNGQYALRFRAPLSVSFVSGAADGVPADWPDRLHADQLEPFNVGHDSFALGDPAAAREVVAAAARVETRFGAPPAQVDWDRAPALLAFWAGPVGCVVAAGELRLIGGGGDEIPLDQVPEMSRRWWAYWKEYWDRRDGADPLPRDYACEVTIPIKSG